MRDISCYLVLIAVLGGLSACAETETPAVNQTPETNTPSSAKPVTTTPRVQIETSLGNFTIELMPEAAPESTKNFLEYVSSGFYNGTLFHRVIPGFMVQGGGFSGDMNRKETRPPIQNEADNGVPNARGTVAMARTSAPHSATAQFFVNVVDNDFLNHQMKAGPGWGYAVFARVVEGMDVVDDIAATPTGTVAGMRDVPLEPVVIEAARALDGDG